MKHRPERGVGILLIAGFIGLVAMASCGAETDVSAAPADDPAIIAHGTVDAEPEATEELSDEELQSDAEQAAAEDLIAGLVGLMILNQLAEEAAAQGGGYNGGYSGDGESYDYAGRWGSGSQYEDGSWNHYSEAAGGAVGGTSDGCIYTTFGWSNC